MPNQLLSGGGRRDFGRKNKGAFSSGEKTVAVIGTAEQLSAQAVPDGFAVVIKAKSTNTDVVHVANSKADAETDANAYRMTANEILTLFVSNLNEIWVDADVATEGISFAVEKE